jgi:hypothetical protein
MRWNLKLSLIIFCLAILLLGSASGFAPTAYSQNEAATPAVPPAKVVEPIIAPATEALIEPVIEEATPRNELTVLELFSSQACVFCPKADELFAALITVPHMIGVACPVDYFDVRNGSLSRPFCSARQSWYMQALGAGPNYTPQIVINGAVDVVGYKLADVTEAIKKAQKNPILPLTVEPGASPQDFSLSWPPQPVPAQNEPAILWLMMIDKPHQLEIADGRNKGKAMTYFNIVSDMEDRGAWDRNTRGKDIKVSLKPEHQGFIVIAQGRQSGKILAAAEYRTDKKMEDKSEDQEKGDDLENTNSETPPAVGAE